MEFRRYMSLKRFGRAEVSNIDVGRCFIFPKLDGTNASVWLNQDGVIETGSRNRLLNESKEGDNAGFCKWARNQSSLQAFLNDYPHLRLYGEWLVPHTVRTYRTDTWKQFYVFDIFNEETEKYLSYEEYHVILDEYDISYIPPIVILNNPTEDQLIHIMKNQNTYLIEDGQGVGEGIVIKNYDYVNSFGVTIWAKMVTNEFKERNRATFGVGEIDKPTVEESIVAEFFTESLIEKEYSKICLMLENKGETFDKKHIPMLLYMIYNEFIREEGVDFITKFKQPTINFRRLNGLCISKIKTTLKEVF